MKKHSKSCEKYANIKKEGTVEESAMTRFAMLGSHHTGELGYNEIE